MDVDCCRTVVESPLDRGRQGRHHVGPAISGEDQLSNRRLAHRLVSSSSPHSSSRLSGVCSQSLCLGGWTSAPTVSDAPPFPSSPSFSSLSWLTSWPLLFYVWWRRPILRSPSHSARNAIALPLVGFESSLVWRSHRFGTLFIIGLTDGKQYDWVSGRSCYRQAGL